MEPELIVGCAFALGAYEPGVDLGILSLTTESGFWPFVVSSGGLRTMAQKFAEFADDMDRCDKAIEH